MLVDGHAVAKPSDVAEIHQHRRRRRRVAKMRPQLLAKQILVTDVGRQTLAGPGHGGLAQRAAVEVAQRYVHHLREPAKQRRDGLPEGHQKDRKRVGEGKRVDIGGGRIIKKKNIKVLPDMSRELDRKLSIDPYTMA